MPWCSGASTATIQSSSSGHCEGLHPSELEVVQGFEIVFMGERQRIIDAWTTWRPDRIV